MAGACEAELLRIGAALGEQAVRLEHVGSTAVPGLAAKPILDLQLSVPSVARLERYAGPLEGLGYLFVPAPESPDFHPFAKPPARPRSHDLHVCATGSDHELRLKRGLVARHPQDRLAYIEGKDEFVTGLEARALEWSRARA